MLRSLAHRNIVQYYGACLEPGSLFFVMELMRGVYVRGVQVCGWGWGVKGMEMMGDAGTPRSLLPVQRRQLLPREVPCESGSTWLATMLVPQLPSPPTHTYLPLSALAAGGDLYTVLRRHPAAMAWGRLGRKVALDVALGLNHLHSRRPAIMHRDLKSPNVLLSGELARQEGVHERGVLVSCSSGVATGVGWSRVVGG